MHPWSVQKRDTIESKSAKSFSTRKSNKRRNLQGSGESQRHLTNYWRRTQPNVFSNAKTVRVPSPSNSGNRSSICSVNCSRIAARIGMDG